MIGIESYFCRFICLLIDEKNGKKENKNVCVNLNKKLGIEISFKI